MNTKTIQKSQNSKNINSQKKSYSNTPNLVKTKILGIGVTNETKDNILKYLVNSLQNSSKNYYIVTPNPEMIVLSRKNSTFKSVLNEAEIALNDGVGVSVAGKIMGKPFKERITGVDFMKSVCEKASVWPITVGFLGGGPHVAEKAAECLLSECPNLDIVYVGQEWDAKAIGQGGSWGKINKAGMDDKRQEKDKVGSIATGQRQKQIDVLFVAFGAPKQELWMSEQVGKIPVRVMVGVGGALDYVSGKVRRAPKWVQKIGCEWLFRLVIQPWRWRRQLALFEFMWLVVKERLKN